MSDFPIGATIKSKRMELGMSTVELARLSGTTKSRISELETGKRPNPTIGRLFKIAAALKIELPELISAALSNGGGNV